MSLANLQQIRWIAFDAVGTLIYPDPSVAVAYHRAAVEYGSRLSIDDIAHRFSCAFQHSESEATTPDDWQRRDALETSEEHERERWRRIVADVLDDVDDPEACFESLYDHFASPAAWRCFPDVAGTLTALQDAGHEFAIASNFDHRLNAICDALPELEPLKVRVISSLAGYRKPSRWFFEKLIEAVRAVPAEILLAGDDRVNDVEGGRAAGLQVIELVRKGPVPDGAIGSLTELMTLLKM